jgi:hypothetical protein
LCPPYSAALHATRAARIKRRRKMRKAIISLVLVMSLTNVHSVLAQAPGFRQISPNEITYTPINTTKNLAAPVPTPPQAARPGFFRSMWAKMPTFLGGSTPLVPQVTPAPAMHTK